MIKAHLLAKNASDAAEDSKPSVIEIGVVNRAIERTCNGRFIRSNRNEKKKTTTTTAHNEQTKTTREKQGKIIIIIMMGI